MFVNLVPHTLTDVSSFRTQDLLTEVPETVANTELVLVKYLLIKGIVIVHSLVLGLICLVPDHHRVVPAFAFGDRNLVLKPTGMSYICQVSAF